MEASFFSERSGRRVAETQQDAFHSLTVKELTTKQRMVIDAFDAGRPPLCSVCGRVRELLDAGRLKVVGARKDLATQTSQQLLVVVPKVAA
jgi:hypothetical protein